MILILIVLIVLSIIIRKHNLIINRQCGYCIITTICCQVICINSTNGANIDILFKVSNFNWCFLNSYMLIKHYFGYLDRGIVVICLLSYYYTHYND
jgi:hypothetical protein